MADTNLYNSEAEEAVISSIIIDPKLIDFADLRPDEFYIGRNKATWSAICDLRKSGSSIDFITLTERLEASGKLEAAGGQEGLARYAGNLVYSSNLEDYAAIVRDKARRRAILQSANELAKLAYSDADIDQAISTHVNTLTSATQTSGGAVHWSIYFDQLYDETADRYANPKDIWGIPTKFTAFDRITGGLQLSELAILSGEPGVGKTMLAMQMGANMADYSPGAIYSLEMKGRAVARRLTSAEAQIETRKIKTGRIDDSEWPAFTHAIEALQSKPVYMSESESWTTSSLRADLTRLKMQHGIQWFIVDYLYLMNDPGISENEKTLNISRGLKQTCKALDLSGIAIHSMNKDGMRSSEGGKGKKPGQADLRGSAQANYDADLICFLKEFSPVTSQEQLMVKPAEAENMRTLWFSKGRELENPRKYIHLVKRPNFPYFGDYAEAEAHRSNGGSTFSQPIPF